MDRAIKLSKTAIRDGLPPFTIGGFVFSAKGVRPQGSPTWDDYTGALEFAKRAHRSSGFWLADLLRYSEARTDWIDRLSQAHDATGLSMKTLKNVRAVGKMDPSIRRPAVDFSLHVEVAGMKPAEQSKWLAHAETEGWTERELRDAIKHSQRRRILDGRADTMHSIEVSVQIDVEAQSPYLAEQAAWEHIKQAVKPIGGKVVSARARAQAVNE